MNGLHTLGRWTADRATATPERTAIDDRGVRVSYRELDTRAAALAEAFRGAGYRRGDRIATLTGNSADQVVLFFACAKAGLVLLPLSWRLSARELAAQLLLADPALLLVEDEFSAVASEAAARLPVPPPSVPLGRTGVEAGPPAPLHPVPVLEPPAGGAVHDDDALLMVFTSGTQAAPKAVVLSHANCFWTNLSLSRTAEIGSHDVVLAVLPQFHAGGWNIQPLLAWWTGATVVLERTFDAGRILALIEDRRVTTMMGVPANYLMLAAHPRFEKTDLSSLGRAVVGGAPMPAPLLRTWHSRGVALAQGYGLSEAGPNVLCLPEEEAAARIGMAGKPYPHVDVAVADPVTGEHLSGPGTGELLVAGPGVFQGYFRDPEATAAALAGGWLHTGDLVERDVQGYLRVIDRLKDIYISGGENVAPAEVEAVLLEHPAVADAAVASEPDPQWGETGVAYVVRRAGTAADAVGILEHCAARLARFKVPSRVCFVDVLPRTSLHKVARARLGRPESGAPDESGGGPETPPRSSTNSPPNRQDTAR